MVILDIRTPEEYVQRHLPGALLIPTPRPPLTYAQHRMLQMHLAALRLPKDTPIGVYCKKGIRSGIATELLRGLGYTNVTDLGGIDNMVQ